MEYSCCIILLYDRFCGDMPFTEMHSGLGLRNFPPMPFSVYVAREAVPEI